MNPLNRVRNAALLATCVLSFIAQSAAAPQAPALTRSRVPAEYRGLPSETPQQFEPVTGSFDYTRRDEMIPMRDGVKLHTVIVVPRGAQGAPILLTRTPYALKPYGTANDDELTSKVVFDLAAAGDACAQKVVPRPSTRAAVMPAIR